MNRVKRLFVTWLLLVIAIMLSGCVARNPNVQTNDHESLACTEHFDNRTEYPVNLTESSAPVVTVSPMPESKSTLPPGATFGSIVVRWGCCKCKKIAGNSLFLYAISEFVFENDLEPFEKQRFLSGWNCFWVRLIRACV